MTSEATAVLESWRAEPALALGLGLLSLLYLRGWRRLRRQIPARFGARQLTAFESGLALLYVAIASPLDAFAGLLLQVHMVQHLLLMSAAPVLLLLGAPMLPLLRGLPAALAKGALGPFLAARELRHCGDFFAHPLVCWTAMSAATWLWHVPGPYQLALRSPFWHGVEHASFLAAGLLFWWPVVQPWPSRAHWPRWTMPLYLLLADVQNTALSALFVFSDRLLYPIYAEVPRLAGISALSDQVTAGALMWVPMSLVYLVPAAMITARVLSPRGLVRPTTTSLLEVLGEGTGGARSPHPQGRAARFPGFDLLALPVFGRIAASLATRRVAQSSMLLAAIALVVDGLRGPGMSPMNLAGVLPWTYWRGFTVVALLALGNVFCFACPFTLPREMARRLGFGRRAWPTMLRSKWPAIGVLATFFWAYEVLALWDDPYATAVLVVAYFAAAFAVDAAYRGASFCKYVCPIGQFHFLTSLLSPFEVRIRQPTVCASCTTHDCLRGGARGRGCETDLFLPRKAGSLDCTFCLDCVRACPHANVGLAAVVPAAEIWRDPERASLGRLSRRLDVAVLALLLVAASIAAAAVMVAPVVRWENALASWLGLDSTAAITSVLLLTAITVAPVALLAASTGLGRWFAGITAPPRELFCRFALALVPLGAATWAAHLLFHLLTGWHSLWPVWQRVTGLGEPSWASPPPLVAQDTLLQLEILLLDAGLLLALYSGWRVAGAYGATPRAALAILLPFALLSLALYAGGVWVFLQPMEMRGMMSH